MVAGRVEFQKWFLNNGPNFDNSEHDTGKPFGLRGSALYRHPAFGIFSHRNSVGLLYHKESYRAYFQPNEIKKCAGEATRALRARRLPRALPLGKFLFLNYAITFYIHRHWNKRGKLNDGLCRRGCERFSADMAFNYWCFLGRRPH